MNTDRVYLAYLDGFSRASLGGRAPRRGLLAGLLPVPIECKVAEALGIADAVRDRAVRTRQDAEGQVSDALEPPRQSHAYQWDPRERRLHAYVDGVKVVLEDAVGRRVIEPETEMPLESIRLRLDACRADIEEAWISHLFAKSWITLTRARDVMLHRDTEYQRVMGIPADFQVWSDCSLDATTASYLARIPLRRVLWRDDVP